MMQDHQPDTDTMREIRRLGQQADHLEYQGHNEEAGDRRRSATALAMAEGRRLDALGDAHTQVARLTERLRAAWDTIDPHDSFTWFIEQSDDPEVVEFRVELTRQKTRILMLKAAKA